MMPARETVAGDALRRLCTSTHIFMLSVIRMRSPDASVSSLLSSNTVLRFSIHSVSTGPSQTIHTILALAPSIGFDRRAARRHSAAKTPSCQSPVSGSMRPNICAAVMPFGFMRSWMCEPNTLVSASVMQSYTIVLPQSAGPTTMMPWRTFFVSYSWMILRRQSGQICRPFDLMMMSSSPSISLWKSLSAVRPGNMSRISASNSSMSSNTSLDRFMSRSVRMNRNSSSLPGFLRSTSPAVRSTDRMLRRPKS